MIIFFDVLQPYDESLNISIIKSGNDFIIIAIDMFQFTAYAEEMNC